MSLMEIIALLAVVLVLGGMVMATRRAAASRKGDSVDSGSSWTADYGDGDGGGD